MQYLGFKLFLIPAFFLIALLFGSLSPIYAETKVDVKFINHPQASFPEQDVFINKNGQAMRVEAKEATDSATLAKTVYSSAQPVDHDPFKLGPKPLGPFPLGKSLGFTMGDWLAGTGDGVYTIDGDNSHLTLNFQKLVPNSYYTVWCSRLSFPPNVKVVDRPCGASDGSENVLKTDSIGAGAFSLKLKQLGDSTKETATVLAIAYHSDGKTYGEKPGDFGSKTHVQLFFLIPPKEAMAASFESPTPQAATTTQPTQISKKVWAVIIGVIALLLIGWWVMRKKPTTPEQPT